MRAPCWNGTASIRVAQSETLGRSVCPLPNCQLPALDKLEAFKTIVRGGNWRSALRKRPGFHGYSSWHLSGRKYAPLNGNAIS
eukprot:3097743-Pyramimonas_sp.AAC.1